MSEHTIPGGPSKGTALSEADDKSIGYWLKRKKEDLDAEPNGKFAADNRSWIEAANTAQSSARKGARWGHS